MRQVRDVRADCANGERVMSRAAQRGEWQHEQHDKQDEPERPELGERLEVEAVGVADLAGDRAVPEPVLLVGSRARAEPGMLSHVVPGDLPHIRTPVARQAEEALVQVCYRAPGAGPSPGELVVGPG